MTEGIPNKIDLPPADAPTPAIAEGAQVQYICESGSALRVGYATATAHVTWVGGRTLTLRSVEADASGGELYVGQGYRLRRLANVAQFEKVDGTQSWRCSEAASSG